MTDNQAMTIEEQAVEAAGIILHAAGSSLRNYTPRAKDEILACTRHAITEAYDRGRRDGLEIALKAIPEGVSDIEYASDPDQTDYNVGYDFGVTDAKEAIRALIEKEPTNDTTI